MDVFEQAVRTVQFLAVDAVEKAKSGHPGTPMALAGITVDLFTRYLRYNPEDPAWPNRDRFVLSCGHASMLLYATLHLAGYALPLEELKDFRQWGSKTPGHPEHGMAPGVETTTGPLGQGVGNAVGLALASKLAAARLDQPDPLIDYRVFALASDGDLMEGVASEAASIAGHLGLDNLIVVYDDNHITIDGKTELSFSENVGQRFEAYGWAVQRVDGHNPQEVRRALDRAVGERGSPSLIIARTHIGIGAPTKQDTAKAHGEPLGKVEVEGTKKAADFPLEPLFHIAPRARELFDQHRARNQPIYDAWKKRVADLDRERYATYQSLVERQVPDNLFEELLRVANSLKPEATRVHASAIEQRVAALIPSLVGGAADLASSTRTTIQGAADVKKGEYQGRNLHFGIREHGMAAILNGLSLSGFFIPFGSTFLIFSDYMRPSVRLAALMDQQVIHVFTHDSIFLGEDGPTHQPIEQLASLRLIPNLDVIRPADALECAAAWTSALTRRHGPTALALCRQKLPPLERPANFRPETMLDGAYILSDAEAPALTLIATGSEVHIAVEAKKLLSEQGKRVRVVSMPCVNAFERWPASRRDALLGAGSRRVSIEAGRTSGWRSIIGLEGIAIGLDRFGASAPAERLAEEFGFTGAKVVARILAEL